MNNKQIVENFWLTMATNDFYAAAQLLHDDYILEWPQSAERIRGRDNFAAINTNYPAEGEWRFTIHQIVAEGDVVATRKAFRGKHMGAFMGVEPTGKEIIILVMDFVRLRNGKYVEHWGMRDIQYIMKQLNG